MAGQDNKFDIHLSSRPKKPAKRSDFREKRPVYMSVLVRSEPRRRRAFFRGMIALLIESGQAPISRHHKRGDRRGKYTLPPWHGLAGGSCQCCGVSLSGFFLSAGSYRPFDEHLIDTRYLKSSCNYSKISLATAT